MLADRVSGACKLTCARDTCVRRSSPNGADVASVANERKANRLVSDRRERRSTIVRTTTADVDRPGASRSAHSGAPDWIAENEAHPASVAPQWDRSLAPRVSKKTNVVRGATASHTKSPLIRMSIGPSTAGDDASASEMTAIAAIAPHTGVPIRARTYPLGRDNCEKEYDFDCDLSRY